MKHIVINPSKCPQDHRCPVTYVCPAGAITQNNPFSAPAVNVSSCTGCGKCVTFCPYGAFEFAKG